MEGHLNHKIFLFFMLTIFLCGATIFLLGFFPMTNRNLNKISSLDDETNETKLGRPNSINGYRLNTPKTIYNQIVLMVVDALRYDFITSDAMPHSYVKFCDHIQIRANLPTVTMPRIKSLITGTISNFIDIVLNLGHTEQLEDSILHQLYKRGDLITFAGDHTWVNLFPDKFHRKVANIDSFFVNDFYEGDDNVTRALEVELQNDDWKLLILHYLGLDHIGHVEGNESPKILKKLNEMDNVVSKIFDAKHFSGQMVFLTSDHGMREGGGHGGSTPEELNVPLLSFTETCEKNSPLQTVYNQIDIAPTLAMLLGIEIPKSSIGTLIPQLLKQYSYEDQLYFHYYNAMHLMEKMHVKYGNQLEKTDYHKQYVKAKYLHKQFLKSARTKNSAMISSFKEAETEYLSLSRKISTELAESTTDFRYDLICNGIILTTLSTVYTLISVFLRDFRSTTYNLRIIQLLQCLALGIIMNFCLRFMRFMPLSLLTTSCISCGFYMTFDILHLLCAPNCSLHLHKNLKLTLPVLTPLAGFLLCHTFFLASSSFIEVEHEIWYYLGTTSFILLIFNIYSSQKMEKYELVPETMQQRLRRQVWHMRWVFFVPFVAAVVRRYTSYVVAILTKSENLIWLSLSAVIALFVLLVQLRQFNHNRHQMLLCAIALTCVYGFRSTNNAVIFVHIQSLAYLALPLFWLCILLLAIWAIAKSVMTRTSRVEKAHKARGVLVLLETQFTCTLLISMLLHKPHNLPLVPAMLFVLHKCYNAFDRLHSQNSSNKSGKLLPALLNKTLLTVMVGKMFYFCQGNSNSLATIDLNPGYIGQSSYSPVIVGTFVTLNTYSAPIIAFFYLLLHIVHGATSINELETGGGRKITLTPSTKEHYNRQNLLHIALSVYTAATLLPVAVYLWLLIFFRHHLFIYSVFAPKVLYECFSVIVFYVLFILTSLYSFNI